MDALIFMCLLIICGMWNITDGWFSLSMYLKDKNQTWRRDHYIRVIRILVGCYLLLAGFYFGIRTLA